MLFTGYWIPDTGYRILDTGWLRLLQPETFKRFIRLNLFVYLTRKMKFNIGVVLYLGI